MPEVDNGKQTKRPCSVLELVDFARSEAEQASLQEPTARQGPLPDCFPGYTIVSEIHRGGQGVVYEAVQRSPKRKVAIKVLRSATFADRVDHVRLQREAEMLARIKHPNIVGVIEAGVAEELPYFVMEFIDGEPLDAYLRSNRYLSVEELTQLFVKICNAVHAAHLQGVVHRDIKPGNILVDAAGEPHVFDLGLGRRMYEASEGGPSVTCTGQFVGSLPWSSPEQVDDRLGPVDIRTDVYSLGVLLYWGLTGEFPYEVHGPLLAVTASIANTDPPRPSTVRKGIDDDLDTIVLKCLAKDRERRYQSAGDMARDLERYLQKEAIDAKRDSTAYMVACLLRRHRGWAISAVCGVALLLLFIATVSVMYRRATIAEATAVAQAKRANEAHRDLQSTASLVIQRLADGLSRVPGASSLRKELLELAYGQLSRLIERGVENPEVQEDYARALVKLSDIARSIGRKEEALEYRRRALEIREGLAERTPDNPDVLRDLAVGYVLIGDVIKEQGPIEETRRLYEKALAIDERLTALYPVQSRFADNLVYSYQRLSDLARVEGNLQTAWDLAEKAMDVATRLVEDHPDDLSAVSSLISCHRHSASLCSIRGDSMERARRRVKALRLARRLVEAERDNPQFIMQLVSLLAEVTDDEFETGKMSADFDDKVREAESRTRRLMSLDPENFEYQVAAATQFDGRAWRALRQDKLEEAERWGGEVSTALQSINPEAANDRDALAVKVNASLLQARLAHSRGEYDARALFASQVIAYSNAMGERPHSDIGTADILARVYLDPVVPELWQPERAEVLARRALEVSGGGIAACWSDLARALHAQKRHSDALEAAERALSMLAPDDFRNRPDMERLVAEIGDPEQGP